MMKLIITILLISFCVFNPSLSAQGNMYNEIQHYGQYFFDIDATEFDVTAAGDNIILNSKDEGVTWQEINLPTNRTQIRHVAKAGEQHYVAAGSALYITTNDGIDWSIQEELDDIVSMQNFGNTIIITRETEEKRFMRSDDGGMSWVTLSTSNAVDPQTLDYLNTNDAFFSDSSGSIYYSFNGGLSWEVLNDSQFSEPIESLRFTSLDHGYVQIGDIVWETIDGGITWTEIIDSFIAARGVYPLPSGLYTASFTRFGFFNGTNLSYVQDDPSIDDLISFDIAEANGKLFMSGSGMILVNDLNESFEKWTDLTPGPDVGFNIMKKRGDKFVLSSGSRMLVSNDNGKTFSSEKTTFSQVSDLDISPDGSIYITQTGLKKSINDGKDWEFIKPNTSLIHVFDDGRLIIAGGNQISQSTDDGETFEALFDIPNGSPRELYFYDQNLGWYLNTSGDAYRTLDGGSTWETITFPFGASPSKMHFIDSQNGFAVKHLTDRFWKTNDGGTTWEEINFTGGNADLLDVYFEDSMIGYVVGRENIFTEGIVFKTEDGGASWEIFHKGINLFYEVTGDVSTGKIYVCGERGQLYSYLECDDLIPTLSVSNNRISCNENSEVYKWYLNGTFLVETDLPYIDVLEGGLYSVRIIGENNCVSKFSVEIDIISNTDNVINDQFINIFPNPSNGQINLDIDANYQLESIGVYHLTGQLIQNFNNVSNSLDLTNIPSGTYFLRIQMEEGYLFEKVVLR